MIVLLTFSMSCTKNFEEFNQDTKNPTVVEGDYLFTQGQLQLADQISNTSVNLNIFKMVSQFWTETTYTDEANYDIVNRSIANGTFRAYYVWTLTPLADAKKIIAEDDYTGFELVQTNKLAIIDIMEVYAYYNLVNIFGDIPYSNALDIDNTPSPAYDNAFTIYQDLIARIDADYASLDVAAESFGSADKIYFGDVSAWKKFAQSLKLRIALNAADYDNTFAKTNVEAAFTAGIFESTDDDALYNYSVSTPYNNPIYDDLVLSGRTDFVPANTIVDIMASLNDPRMDYYFQDQVSGVYVGGEYGYANSYSNSSHINDMVAAPDFPGFFMTYTEVLFYLAEADERGYSVGTTADAAYATAVTESILFWGGSNSDATTYLAQPEVDYATAVAASSWQEVIGTQAWLAFYTRGQEAWDTYRRLDYPVMNVALEPATDGPVPTRFTYPINEQTLNADNYAAASTAIGGDLLLTRLFWDASAPAK